MIRIPIVLILVTLLIVCTGFIPKPQACDQRALDLVYKAIFVRLVQSKGTQQDYTDKHNALAGLKLLCNNQLSTYEIPKHNFNRGVE
jgi:hypothetical protein